MVENELTNCEQIPITRMFQQTSSSFPTAQWIKDRRKPGYECQDSIERSQCWVNVPRLR